MNETRERLFSLVWSDELAEAEQQAKELLEVDSSSADAKLTLALIHDKSGTSLIAIELLEEVLKNNPKDRNALLIAAQILERQKDFDKAIKLYKEFLTESPDHTFAYYRLGKIYESYYYNERSVEEAKRYYLLATGGENPIEDAFVALAGLENSNRAVYVIRNGLRIFPQSVPLYQGLVGKYLYRLNDPAIALEILDEAMNNSAESVELDWCRTLAHFKVARYDDALSALATIEPVEGPYDQESTFFRSMILLEQGKFTEVESICSDLYN